MGSSTKRDVGHLPSKPLIVKPVKPNLTYLKRVLRHNDGATRRQMPSETPTSVSLKSGWRQWVSVLWAIKLDHLQPVELILSQYISTFLTFILGGPIPYYPRERKRWKSRPAGAENGEKGFTKNWRRHRGFCTWGIRIGPFAAWWADCVPKIFHPPDLHYGESNSYYPRDENGNKGFTKNWMRNKGFCTWGIQIGSFVACWADFVPKNFHLPDLHYEEFNSYYPRAKKWGTGTHLKLDETQWFLYWGHSNLTICSL